MVILKPLDSTGDFLCCISHRWSTNNDKNYSDLSLRITPYDPPASLFSIMRFENRKGVVQVLHQKYGMVANILWADWAKSKFYLDRFENVRGAVDTESERELYNKWHQVGTSFHVISSSLLSSASPDRWTILPRHITIWNLTTINIIVAILQWS